MTHLPTIHEVKADEDYDEFVINKKSDHRNINKQSPKYDVGLLSLSRSSQNELTFDQKKKLIVERVSQISNRMPNLIFLNSKSKSPPQQFLDMKQSMEKQNSRVNVKKDGDADGGGAGGGENSHLKLPHIPDCIRMRQKLLQGRQRQKMSKNYLKLLEHLKFASTATSAAVTSTSFVNNHFRNQQQRQKTETNFKNDIEYRLAAKTSKMQANLTDPKTEIQNAAPILKGNIKGEAFNDSLHKENTNAAIMSDVSPDQLTLEEQKTLKLKSSNQPVNENLIFDEIDHENLFTDETKNYIEINNLMPKDKRQRIIHWLTKVYQEMLTYRRDLFFEWDNSSSWFRYKMAEKS